MQQLVFRRSFANPIEKLPLNSLLTTGRIKLVQETSNLDHWDKPILPVIKHLLAVYRNKYDFTGLHTKIYFLFQIKKKKTLVPIDQLQFQSFRCNVFCIHILKE